MASTHGGGHVYVTCSGERQASLGVSGVGVGLTKVCAGSALAFQAVPLPCMS